MTTQPPEERRPEIHTPEYEPPDFPPRGHHHRIPGVTGGAHRPDDDEADQASRKWRDRTTGRPTMFGSAAVVFVLIVLIVLLVLWLVGVF